MATRQGGRAATTCQALRRRGSEGVRPARSPTCRATTTIEGSGAPLYRLASGTRPRSSRVDELPRHGRRCHRQSGSRGPTWQQVGYLRPRPADTSERGRRQVADVRSRHSGIGTVPAQVENGRAAHPAVVPNPPVCNREGRAQRGLALLLSPGASIMTSRIRPCQ
jgi:hypothetical protein